MADLTPHTPHRSAERQRFMPVDDLVAGLGALGDWGVNVFADERRLLDSVLDDADRDPWATS